MPGQLPCLCAVVTGENLIVITAWDRADDNTLIDTLLGKLL